MSIANLLFQKAKQSEGKVNEDYLNKDIASFFSVEKVPVYESNEGNLFQFCRTILV